MDFIKLAQSFSTPFLDGLFQLITMMGEEYFIFAAVTLLLWCVDKEFAYRVGFAYASNAVINVGLKEIFQVPRPAGEGIRQLRLETATGYSFPSGHTQSAASFWTSVMIQLKRKWVYLAGVIIIALVALSRIYLGVHTPADVLGGTIIGSVWVFASNRVYDYAAATGRKSVYLLFIIPMLAGLLLFPSGDYYKASGAFAGFYAGYLIESKYIRLEIKASLLVQAVKFAAGMAVLILIKILLKNLLPDIPLSHFLRYFLMGIWVTAIAPCLFKHLLNKKGAYSSD